MDALIGLIIAIVGLIFGSFAGATVWRVRARQLLEDKKAGELIDGKELTRLKPLTQATLTDDRSRCLSCEHELAWYDLIPLASWLSTRGRCRYCKTPIGWFEPLMELGTAIVFLALYIAWLGIGVGPLMVPLLVLWLLAALLLVMLFAYDVKWFLLPNMFVFPLIGVSALIALVNIFGTNDSLTTKLVGYAGAVIILSGLYAVLYYYSRARYGEERTWVGFGDVKLGIALGLLLGSWQLAFLALFLANFIGVLLLLPSLLSRKLTMTSRIPLGPLLIAGFFLSLFFGHSVLSLYQDFSLKLSDMLMTLML